MIWNSFWKKTGRPMGVEPITSSVTSCPAPFGLERHKAREAGRFRPASLEEKRLCGCTLTRSRPRDQSTWRHDSLVRICRSNTIICRSLIAFGPRMYRSRTKSPLLEEYHAPDNCQDAVLLSSVRYEYFFTRRTSPRTVFTVP